MAFTFTDANFAEETKQGVSVVDFWAPWCGPCQMIGPVIEELATKYEGKVKIGKLNVDENTRVPSEFGIMGIPAIKFIKDGNVVDEISGAVPKELIEEKITALI